MSIPAHLVELHDEFQFHSADDALELIASFARSTLPGEVSAVFLDDERRIVEIFTIIDGEPLLPMFVTLTCSVDETDVTGLILFSNRTGQEPADRPDDELTWQELVAHAAEGGVTLLDWFVTCGWRWSFSLAQFAPTPAQW